MSICSNNNTNSDLNILLNNMKKYMLFDDNISLFKRNDNDINKIFFNKKTGRQNESSHHKDDYKNEDPEFFYINKNDQLFWCFYIIKNGYDNYEINKNNSFYLEKSIKINSIEKLREKKDLLKINKLKLNEIENELANEKLITIKGFIALLLINDLNIFYVGDSIFYKFISNNDKQIFIVKYNKQIKKLGVNINDSNGTNDTNKYIKNITETKMELFDIAKQIKGISSYKLGDLQDICNKLKINIKDNDNKNLKKTLLYETILIKLKEDSINNIS